ncbi:hypothetical protein ACLOJK_004710 [Asimina triloba]
MTALIRCVNSNDLLVGRDGFSPDLKRKKMATIADGDGPAVDFKQMLSIAARSVGGEMESRQNRRRRRPIWDATLDYFQICCRRAAVNAMIGEKKPSELDVEAALLAGFSDRRR